MANTLDHGYVEKLLNKFIPEYESARVFSKLVNQTVLQGQFQEKAGGTIYMKKPHRYKTVETAEGDVTNELQNEIKTAKVAATVQNMITVKIPWTGYEQALKIDDMPETIFRPAAEALANQEDNLLVSNIMKYATLTSGNRGTPVNTWSHVASADALLTSIGATQGNRYFVMNPFTSAKLAGAQLALPSGNGGSNSSAWEKAQMSADLGGFQAFKASNLPVYQTGSMTDRAGTLSGTIDTAYDTYADSLQHFTMTITSLTANDVINPYQKIEIPSIHRLNQSNGTVFVDDSGQAVSWSGVILPNPVGDGTYTVASNGSVSIKVGAPIIHEKSATNLGQYDTVNTAPSAGNVVTISGPAGQQIQPNLFFHRDAFVAGSLPIPKMEGLATRSATSSGVQVRMTFVPDGMAFKQCLRVDLWPTFGVVNPEMAGQCFGY